MKNKDNFLEQVDETEVIPEALGVQRVRYRGFGRHKIRKVRSEWEAVKVIHGNDMGL